MCVLNELDRFHLFEDVIDRVPHLGSNAAYEKQMVRDKLIEHREYVRRARPGHARDPRLEVERSCRSR